MCCSDGKSMARLRFDPAELNPLRTHSITPSLLAITINVSLLSIVLYIQTNLAGDITLFLSKVRIPPVYNPAGTMTI